METTSPQLQPRRKPRWWLLQGPSTSYALILSKQYLEYNLPVAAITVIGRSPVKNVGVFFLWSKRAAASPQHASLAMSAIDPGSLQFMSFALPVQLLRHLLRVLALLLLLRLLESCNALVRLPLALLLSFRPQLEVVRFLLDA